MWRAMEPGLSRWADGDYLAALTVDYLANLTWMFQAANFKNGDKARKPRPLWRPTDPEPVNATDALAAYDEIMALIEQQTGAPRGIAPAETV